MRKAENILNKILCYINQHSLNLNPALVTRNTSLRGHQNSIFKFFNGIQPLGERGSNNAVKKISKSPNQKLHQVLRK